MHTYAHTCTHTYTHMHTHAHIYAHTCTHICILAMSSLCSTRCYISKNPIWPTLCNNARLWLKSASQRQVQKLLVKTKDQEDEDKDQEDDDVLATVYEVFLCLSHVEGVNADIQNMKGVIHRHIKRADALKAQKEQAIKLARHWKAACQKQRTKHMKLQDQCDKLLADNNDYKIRHEQLGVWMSQTPLWQDCHDECSGGQAGQSSARSGGQQQDGKAFAGSQHGPADSQLPKPMQPSHEPPSYLLRAFKLHRNSGTQRHWACPKRDQLDKELTRTSGAPTKGSMARKQPQIFQAKGNDHIFVHGWLRLIGRLAIISFATRCGCACVVAGCTCHEVCQTDPKIKCTSCTCTFTYSPLLTHSSTHLYLLVHSLY